MPSHRAFSAIAFSFYAVAAMAQDDITTRNAGSAWNGGYITGPASNPLSFVNGPAYRTFGSPAPYDLPDLRPMGLLDDVLPPWITFGFEERFRYEGYHDGGFKLHNDDSYLLLRSRLQVNIQPAGWLKIVGQLQDARPFMQKPPWGPPNENTWDLKLAYAEFGDPEKHWISLRVGRQLLSYNNTMIADSQWRNQGRSFDAVAANLHYERARLGIFAASAVVPQSEGISHHQEGNNIYGAYGNIANVLPNSSLEPFVLWRVRPGLNEKAFGFRFKGLVVSNLDYSFEAVAERGTNPQLEPGSNGSRAWATTFGAGYRINGVLGRPRLFAQYDYASGTFDTMYPTAHDRFGITDQFGWQNIVAARGGLTIEPRRRWTVTAQYLDFRLANAADPLYGISGTSIVRDGTGKSGPHIGDEFDLYTWYELNRHVNVGVGVGHILPGHFLEAETKGPTYNYPYFAINFKDDGKPGGR